MFNRLFRKLYCSPEQYCQDYFYQSIHDTHLSFTEAIIFFVFYHTQIVYANAGLTIATQIKIIESFQSTNESKVDNNFKEQYNLLYQSLIADEPKKQIFVKTVDFYLKLELQNRASINKKLGFLQALRKQINYSFFNKKGYQWKFWQRGKTPDGIQLLRQCLDQLPKDDDLIDANNICPAKIKIIFQQVQTILASKLNFSWSRTNYMGEKYKLFNSQIDHILSQEGDDVKNISSFAPKC